MFILASTSSSRYELLSKAGLSFEVIAPQVDEAPIKECLLGSGSGPDHIASTLADAKAVAVSRRHPGRSVLGGDQVVSLDGRTLDKPVDMEEAARRLNELRGRSHEFISAVSMAENGRVVWRSTGRATARMRNTSCAFRNAYLAREGTGLLSVCAGYRFEGMGAQMIEEIRGDYFSALGLPLLEVISQLRARGLLPT